MKRLLFWLAVLICLGLVFILPISSFLVWEGFAHHDEEWAPDAVYFAARVNMRLMRFETARSILERTQKEFPNFEQADRVCFLIGVCHEKADNTKAAIGMYEEFLKRWPSHVWADQARRRIEELKARGS